MVGSPIETIEGPCEPALAFGERLEDFEAGGNDLPADPVAGNDRDPISPHGMGLQSARKRVALLSHDSAATGGERTSAGRSGEPTPAEGTASTEFFATKRRRRALTVVEVPPSGVLIKPCRSFSHERPSHRHSSGSDFGGGGGYYAHGRYGTAGLGGVLGLVLVILLVIWLVGGVGYGPHV